MFLVRSN